MKKLLLVLLLLLSACGSAPMLTPQTAHDVAQSAIAAKQAVDRAELELARLRAVVTAGCAEPALLPADVCADGQSAWNHMAEDYETVVRPALDKIEAALRYVP
jgi:hypothetical protein